VEGKNKPASENLTFPNRDKKSPKDKGGGEISDTNEREDPCDMQATPWRTRKKIGTSK